MTIIPGGRKNEAEAPTLSEDLRAIILVFTSRWRLILLTIATFLLLGVAFIWISQPGYSSSVDIFIDPRERNLVNLDVAQTGMGSSSQGADTALVESQIAIIGSRWVLGRLIERENLENIGEFGGGASDGLVSSLKEWAKALVYGPNSGSYNRMTPFDRALLKLQRSVKVKRVGQTYVINVGITTGSPERSARIANAIAEIYLAEGQNAIDNSALESARSLEARLVELQKVSEDSQRMVESYRAEQGLIGTQGVLMDEQKLSDLTTQVMSATIATQAARSALDEINRSDRSGVNSILSSEIAGQLRLQLDRAISEESAMARTYGDRHPRLVQARETRQSIQSALEAELGRVRARAMSDYQKTADTEASLKALLSQFETRMKTSNSASVRLRELQQVAERDRALYDTFATRAKQAREQIALPTTTARIISVAEPASRPSEPRVSLVLAISMFLGAVTGLGLAWLMHLFAAPAVSDRPIGLVSKSRNHYANAAE